MDNKFIRAEEVAQELSVSKPYAYKFWCWMKSPAGWTFFPQMLYCRFWSVTTRNLAVPIC